MSNEAMDLPTALRPVLSAIEPTEKVRRRGLLFILSSPSGAGKTTLSRRLLAVDTALTMSVSVTTRPPRRGECDGVDYSFISRERFDEMVRDGELLEHATVFDRSYGSPRAPVECAIGEGRDVLFDVDWQGARQIREALGKDVVSVFILPPSVDALEQRLRSRAQDDEQTVMRRMAKARDEISHWRDYDYVLINDDLEKCTIQLASILAAERMALVRRQAGLGPFVEGMGVS